MKGTELPPKQPQKQFEVMCCVYKNAGTETGQMDTTDMSRKKTPTCTTFTSIMLRSRENSGGDFSATKIIVTVWIKLVFSLPLKWLLLRRGRGL